MIHWKEKKFRSGNISYKLMIDGREILTIDYHANCKSDHPFTHTSYWGSRAIVDEPLEAKTEQEAKTEVLEWLKNWYHINIHCMEAMIKSYEHNIQQLENFKMEG